MTSAMMPASMNQMNEVMKYRLPMTLWSVVVTHLTTVAPFEGRRVWAGVRVGAGAVLDLRGCFGVGAHGQLPPSGGSGALWSCISCSTAECVVEQAGLTGSAQLGQVLLVLVA